MARQPRPAAPESPSDLARKVEILEREMSVQRAAIEKLKQLGGTTAPGTVSGGRAGKDA